MKLKALRALRYAGKSVLKGDVFEVLHRDERVLVAASIAEHYVEPPKKIAAVFKPIKPVELPDDPPEVKAWIDSSAPEPAKRAYKRRDMTAE